MKNGKILGILASVVLLVSAYFAPALADENSWSTGGPYGASIMDIALHPSDTLRLYIGTVSSGIFQTTDGGEEWFRIEDDTLDITLRRIRIHPFGPDTIYASTTYGIFKSTDAGQSWFRLPTPSPTDEYRALEIHPDIPSMIFAGCLGGCIKSTDGGASWYRNSVLSNVVDIAIDPVNTNIVYITGGRDYKSEDYGETWYDISPDPVFTTTPMSIAIDPVDTETIYLGRGWDPDTIGTCLYKSTNGGGDWIDITPSGLVLGTVEHVVVSPFDHNTVFIATRDDGCFRSGDGGRNWEEINDGLAVRKARRIIIDPRTGCLYLGLYSDGIYRSLDNGDSWQKISNNVTGAYCRDLAINWRHPDTLYTATEAGLFISADGADSWRRVSLDYSDDPFFNWCYVEVDPYDPGYVYVALGDWRVLQRGDFQRSSDGGSTWESSTEGLPSNTCYTNISVADYGSGWRRLFLATSAGVYYSDDLGENWSFCQGGLPSDFFQVVAVSPVNPEIVFAGDDRSNAVYKSMDGGLTWEGLTMPRGEGVWDIICDPVDQDILYVAMNHNVGILKSTDGGLSWDNINNNLPRGNWFHVSGVAVNPLNHDNIFAYSAWRGIFQSHDGGQSWQDFFNESLRIGSSAYTLIDPVDTSRVFLAMSGGSVWEITRTPTAIDDDLDYILPVAFSASSYPNPFNPSATIEYSLPEEASVTVEVYDLLGRKVETLVARNQQAGTHRVVWDAKDRASGLYFYLINAERHSQTGIMTLLK